MKRNNAAVVGVGAACVACCVGPILGLLAAIGIGTAAGVAMFGMFGLLVAAVGVMLVARRRTHRNAACSAQREPVPVELSKVGASR